MVNKEYHYYVHVIYPTHNTH